LPPNSALLKSVNAPGGQNAAPKLFNPANAMALNNHRSTPPIPSATFPTFQQLRPQQLPPASNTQQQQQRILAGFPPHGLDTNAITNDSDFPALNKRASPASQNNIFGTFNNLQQSMSMYASPTKEAIGSMQQRMPYG
jgi:hypothetical protein